MNLNNLLNKIRVFFIENFRRFFIFLAVLGPGTITAFADNDAAGVATYSVAASKFGYQILTILIPITVVLAVTQEIGARLAIITGKGLGDLIRERFGIRISLLIFFILFFVNFVVIVQNLGGLKDALGLFNLNYMIFLPLVVTILFLFIIFASYKKIERFFLLLILFYLAYFFSAILSRPNWDLAIKSLFIPKNKVNFDYLFTSVAVLGTTVTAWGQFFINSYIKDKKLTPSKLKYEQLEVYIGAILTDVISFFIIIAVAATLFVNRIEIKEAATASLAIVPLAGNLAGSLFGMGLLVAGLLGCAIVPLTTAYAFSEFFGLEGSLDTDFKKSRLFYSFFIIQIVVGTIVVFLPQIALFKITLYANFLNGIILPIIFFFLYKFANDEELMGKYKNGRIQNILLVGAGVAITIAAILGAIGNFFNL